MILLAPFFDAVAEWRIINFVSDSSQFDCRGRSSVLCFVMANALSFNPSLRYAASLYSVFHQHFLYHMYIHVVSVGCYNALCFFPCLNSLLFWYSDFSLDVNFMGCICIANFYLSEV